MATPKTVNISALFENNLRRVSEVGVGTFQAVLANEGDRLNQGSQLVEVGTTYQIVTIPADSIATKFYFIVDEPFDGGAKAEVKTLGKAPKTLVAALDLAVKGATVSTIVDQYFETADGFAIKIDKAVTKGSFRIVAEFISGSTNNGIYVDLPA